MSKKLKGFIIKLVIVVCIVLFFIFIGKLVFNSLKYGEGISGVRKELSIKYSSINCIKDDCSGILANLDDKVLLFNKDGKKLTTFTNLNEQIIDNSDEYYISFIDNNYYVKDFDNEVIYKSKNNNIEKINDYLILVNNNTIINKNKEKLYNNLEKVNFFYNNKYIVIKKDNKYSILDKKGNIIFNDKIIENVIENEYYEEKAFIIKNLNKNEYNYYKIDDDKIVGDSFISYKKQNNIYIVTKNNKEYILKINGDQVLLDENKNLLEEKIHIINDEDNIKISNSDNKVVIDINKDSNLFLSDNYYIYQKDNIIKFYSIKNDKTYEYELGENEKLISIPFRKTIFIYNDRDGYIKLIDFKGSKIDKIYSDNEPIIKFNKYEKNAYIIVNHNDNYGMYIAN